MREYRVSMKVQNNLLLTAIEQNGYASVRQFAHAIGMPRAYSSIADLVGMRHSPLGADGQYRPMVLAICAALHKTPGELFSEEQHAAFPTTTAEFEIGIEEVANLLPASPQADAPLVAGEWRQEFYQALDGLPPRCAEVLRRRFGLEGDCETLDQIAKDFGVSRDRVRQIEQQALCKLRHPRLNLRALL